MNPQRFSSEFWYLILGLFTMAIGGSLWLGSLNRQAETDGVRIDRLEAFRDGVIAHNADTLARETASEHRLDLLSNKLDAHHP